MLDEVAFFHDESLPDLTLKSIAQCCRRCRRPAARWYRSRARIGALAFSPLGTETISARTTRTSSCCKRPPRRSIRRWIKRSSKRPRGTTRKRREASGLLNFAATLLRLLDDATIDAAIDDDRPIELPKRYGLKYHGFVDMSGGRSDAAVLCIGHAEEDRFIVDAVIGRAAPFDPGAVVAEFTARLKDYGCRRVVGDNYSAAWVETAFRDAGCAYELAPMPKSQLYLEAVPWFNRGAVRIPDLPVLTRELRLLERRTSRLGRDSVDHGRGGHDDYANAVVGALSLAVAERKRGKCLWGTHMPEGGPLHWSKDDAPRRELRIVTMTEAEALEQNGGKSLW